VRVSILLVTSAIACGGSRDVGPDAGATGDASSGSGNVVDPTLLPVATPAQFPLTADYDALGVPALPAGGSYRDPTTGVRIVKLTSASVPAAGASWGHAYSEGNNEVSLPYDGDRRAVHVYTSNGQHFLVNVSPATGVTNPRPLPGVFGDMGVTFSSDPRTPYYVFLVTDGGSAIRRFDLRTLAEAPGAGWPVTGETEVFWLHQSENDALFTWMRGANGSTIVAYLPATATRKTYTNPGLNEPRIDRAGRYVGIAMTTPANGSIVWDVEADAIVWQSDGAVPFAHQASLKRRWYGVNWNLSFPGEFWTCAPDVPDSFQLVGGPATGTLVYGNGSWNQPGDPDAQWALFSSYGSLYEGGSTWLAPGGLVLVTASGERRLLGHAYNTTGDYTFYTFAKLSSDGRYALFTSDMNGAGRSDLFLAELPVR